MAMDPTDQPVSGRVKEPSSWIGTAAVLGSIAAVYLGKPTLADPAFWASVAGVVSGVTNILVRERKPKK